MHSSYTLILCVVSISHYTQPLFLITIFGSPATPSYLSDSVLTLQPVVHFTHLWSFCHHQTDHSSMYPSLICPSSIHPFIHHPPFHPPSTLMVLCSMYWGPYSTHLTHLSNYSPTHHLPPAIFCCRGAGSLSPWRDQRLLKSSMTSRISP